MFRISYAIALVMLAIAVSAPMQARAETVITGVKVEVLKGGIERISFQANQPITPKTHLAIPDPDRIAINIPSVRNNGVKLPDAYKGKLLKSIRFGQFDPTTSRIVLDLAQPASVHQIKEGSPLVVELIAGQHAEVAVTDDSDADDNAPAKTPAPPQAAEKKLPLITIDAGHGGQDPGTQGLHDTQERDVTLNYAKTLARALEATGRYHAKLTRDDDTYIPLPERVEIGRRAHTDLFISLHADSNPRPEARGLSIYTLSATASDAEAEKLADRENKSDIISGLDLNTTDADVANILIDLTQRETMNKSTNLADDIVRSLHPKINKLPATHRFAGFRVLKAPDVPSVLIELGFLSNATDERLLLSTDYRDVVINSIIKGIDRYYAGQ